MFNFLPILREAIARWWSEFTLQTKLMAAATLAVSLLMSGLTFWAVNTIQQDVRLNDIGGRNYYLTRDDRDALSQSILEYARLGGVS